VPHPKWAGISFLQNCFAQQEPQRDPASSAGWCGGCDSCGECNVRDVCCWSLSLNTALALTPRRLARHPSFFAPPLVAIAPDPGTPANWCTSPIHLHIFRRTLFASPDLIRGHLPHASTPSIIGAALMLYLLFDIGGNEIPRTMKYF